MHVYLGYVPEYEFLVRIAFTVCAICTVSPGPPLLASKKDDCRWGQRPNGLVHDISNNVVCATSKNSDRSAHTRSLIRAFAPSLECSMSVKLLTQHLLEVLSLKGGCTCSSESTLVKKPLCWKSRVTAQI